MPRTTEYRKPPSDRGLTTEQAAAKMGISKMALAHKRSRGQGPRYYRDGRSIRYKETDVDRWLASRKTFGGDQ